MADLPQHHQGPLVTIHFEWEDERAQYASNAELAAIGEPLRESLTIIRHWHHVPRDGDHVTLVEGEETYDGNVRAVWWNDDGTIKIPLT